MAREFMATKCRHRKRIKTIRLDDSEREFLERRAKIGRTVNDQIRALVQGEMRRSGVAVKNPVNFS